MMALLEMNRFRRRGRRERDERYDRT